MKSFAIKFYSFLAVLLVSMGCLSIHSCKNNDAKSEDHDALAKFMTSFSDSTAFAIVDMGDTPVLLVSNETYINNEENQSVLNAIAAQVYVLDEADKVVCLGEIRSQGTLYPIATDGKSLMTAGHRFVNNFIVNDADQSLRLSECIQGTVLEPDVVTYSYENRDENVYENNKNEAFFEQMIARFESAQPIVFYQGIKSVTLWNGRMQIM